MKVWIDLANAPHVPFFGPIMKALRRDGHELMVTMRDFNRTIELAQRFGITGLAIGTHGGRSYIGKALNFVQRSVHLASAARSWRPDVAVSHNSYTHILAARLIGCRAVTIMDYEGQPANHVAFRLAHKVIVPDCFPKAALERFGAHEKKVHRYDGFKEQLYLSSYTPSECQGPPYSPGRGHEDSPLIGGSPERNCRTFLRRCPSTTVAEKAP